MLLLSEKHRYKGTSSFCFFDRLVDSHSEIFERNDFGGIYVAIHVHTHKKTRRERQSEAKLKLSFQR
jgi:hypothetical protein